jgi:4-amino-4-deoxy-L-arabinose transferase-like glycosyltransferase
VDAGKRQRTMNKPANERGRKARSPYFPALGVAVFLLSYLLMLSSTRQHSATVDEQSHLFRGLAYLESGATHFLLGHPLLASSLSALPLLTEAEVELPTESAAWAEGDWSVAGSIFLWRLATHPLRLLFLGRLIVIWLSLLLGALVFRWGRQWAGRGAGLAAMTLVLLDPNVIAHGRLVTGDLPLTLFFVLALYGYWRYARPLGCRRAAPAGLLITGLGLGLAAATKFNALLILPILAAQALFLSWQRRTLRPVAALVPIIGLAWFVVAAFYRFELWQGFLPGGSFWDDLLWQGEYVQQNHPVYFFGRVAEESWWSYFPATFLLKTPVATQLLLLAALVLTLVRPDQQDTTRGARFFFLVLPPLLYLVASSAAALNIGYRYLVPMLPFLALFIANVLFGRRPGQLPQRTRGLATVLLLLLALRTITVWPNYISYFNLATGSRGWRLLADSNVDWGQDLPALSKWQKQLPAERVLYLSYFGTASPVAYGVRFQPLPTWAPALDQGDPTRQTFSPVDPAPGLYAISVNNLHGVVLDQQRDTFAWFRDREPLVRLGGSIYVYEVPARGPPVDLALSGLRPARLSEALRQTLGSNDIRVRWFDHRSSFVWPAGGGWMGVPSSAVPPPELAPFWPAAPATQAGGQALYWLEAGSTVSWLLPPAGDGPLRFRGATKLPAAAGEVAMLTAWEVVTPSPAALKLFVHALDGAGNIAGQWDGLDVPSAYWRPGDVIVQSHRFTVPDSTRIRRIVAGVYDGAKMTRFSEHTIEEG